MAGHLLVWRQVVAIELGIEFNKTDSARDCGRDRTDSPAGFVSLFNIHGQYSLDPHSQTELEMESADSLLDLPDPSSIDLAGPSDTSTDAESDSELYSGIAGADLPDSSAGEPETELSLASVAPVKEDGDSEPATPVSAQEEQVTGNEASASGHEEQATGNPTSADEEQLTGNPLSAGAHEEQLTGNAASASRHEEQVTGNPVRASGCEEQLPEISGPEPASLASTSHVSSERATAASATAKGEEAVGPESATPANASPKEEQKTEDVRSASPVQGLVTEEVGYEPASPARASAEVEYAIGIVDKSSSDSSGAQEVDYSGIGYEEQDNVPHVEPAQEEVGFDNTGPSDTHDDEAVRPPNLVKLPSEDDLVRSSHTELAGATEAQPDSKSEVLDIGSARTNPPELSEPDSKLILPSLEPEMEGVDYADYAYYEDYAGFSSGELHTIPVVEPVMGVVAFNIAGPSNTNDDDEENLPPRDHLPSEDVRSHQLRPSSTEIYELYGPSSTIGQEDLTRLPISEPRGTTADIRTHSGRFSRRYSFVPSSIELDGLKLAILPELERDGGNADTEPVPADPVATEHPGSSNTPAEDQVVLASEELQSLEIVGSNPASSDITSAREQPGIDSGDPSHGQSFDTAGASYVELEIVKSGSDNARPSGTKNVEEIVEELPSDQIRTLKGIADTADPVATEDAGPSDTSAEQHVTLASVELALELVGSNEEPGSDRLGDSSGGPSFETAGDRIVEERFFPSVEPKNKSIAFDEAGPSGTKNEEEIVEDLPSDLEVHPDLAGPSSPKGKRKLPTLRILKPRDISEDIGSTGTPHCRNFCGSDDEDGRNKSSLDDLVEIGCNCKGDLSRMCLKCLMKWFSPRILVQGKPECEICKAPLAESVRELMLSKYADPTGGGLEFIEAVGQMMEREHNRRVRRMNAGQGFKFAWLLALTQGPPAPAPPAPAPPAPPAPETLSVSTAPDVPLPPPEPQPPQRRRRSFWIKFGKVFKCGAPRRH